MSRILLLSRIAFLRRGRGRLAAAGHARRRTRRRAEQCLERIELRRGRQRAERGRSGDQAGKERCSSHQAKSPPGRWCRRFPRVNTGNTANRRTVARSVTRKSGLKSATCRHSASPTSAVSDPTAPASTACSRRSPSASALGERRAGRPVRPGVPVRLGRCGFHHGRGATFSSVGGTSTVWCSQPCHDGTVESYSASPL